MLQCFHSTSIQMFVNGLIFGIIFWFQENYNVLIKTTEYIDLSQYRQELVCSIGCTLVRIVKLESHIIKQINSFELEFVVDFDHVELFNESIHDPLLDPALILILVKAREGCICEFSKLKGVYVWFLKTERGVCGNSRNWKGCMCEFSKLKGCMCEFSKLKDVYVLIFKTERGVCVKF